MGFLDTLFNYIELAFEAFYNLLTGFFQIFKIIPDIAEFISSMGLYMPTYAAAAFTLTTTCLIVLFIIGRKNV